MPFGYTYITGSHTGVLYVGVTSDLDVRVLQHKDGVFEGFSKDYGCTRLLYFETYDDIRRAIAREKQLKGWRREKKLALIRKVNPEFRDLGEQLGGSSSRSTRVFVAEMGRDAGLSEGLGGPSTALRSAQDDRVVEGLERSLTLRGAVALNLLDMIGVGPFLTLPLLVAAMGGPQAMLGWVLGALLAACDGLVWAELGAAMPEAGGTYRYLAEMFPGRLGRWLSFLFVFQLCFSAPLSVASGCIGLAQYAGFVWPSLRVAAATHAVHMGSYAFGVSAGRGTVLAIAAVVVAVALQYRRLRQVKWIAFVLLAVVLLTIAWAVATGVLRGHWTQVVAFPPDAWRLDGRFFAGLGSAMLIATYDYWGYYNVSFLGGEVRDPARVIPRAVLASIAVVAVLYMALNASVLSVLGAPSLLAAGNLDARRALLSEFMRVAWTPVAGASAALWMGKLAAVLVMVTAFASVFSLLLGYSRIPFAAARDGNFLRVFGKLHPRGRFPYVSLLVLAGVACVCCFFSLADVIAALVVVRILLQFAMQHVGLMVWRRREPNVRRPFRVWLYPLPPVLALLGFGYVVVSRAGFAREVVLAAAIAVLGTFVFLARGRRTAA